MAISTNRPDDKKANRIYDISQNIFDFIWDKQNIKWQNVRDGCLNRKESTRTMKADPFIECIGNAVRVTSFFLREYFCYFVKSPIRPKVINPKTSPFLSKEDVMKLWLEWITYRENIHVKVIDTFALIALAFLHREQLHEKTNLHILEPQNHEIKKLNLDEVIEWFIEIFTEYLESDFPKNSGWEQLQNFCNSSYSSVFHSLNTITNINGRFNHLVKDYEQTHNCAILDCIKNSIVHFPFSIPPDCKNQSCTLLPEMHRYRGVVYVKLPDEYEKMSFSNGKKIESEDESMDVVENYQNAFEDNKIFRIYIDKWKLILCDHKTKQELDQTTVRLFSNSFADSFQNLFEHTFLNDFKILVRDNFDNSLSKGIEFFSSLDRKSLIEPSEEGAAEHSKIHPISSKFRFYHNSCMKWIYKFYFIGKKTEEDKKFVGSDITKTLVGICLKE